MNNTQKFYSRNTLFNAIVGFSFFLSASLVADELNIPQNQAAYQNLPKTGQTKNYVSDKFGSPSSQSGPVGEPPISFWDYPLFTVYFEYDRVIHTVNKERSQIR